MKSRKGAPDLPDGYDVEFTLIRHRLHDSFSEDLSPYEVIGDPKDLASAAALAQEDRHQFELWALGLVESRPARATRGADSGIDGYINFFDDNSGRAKTATVQVKSGHVNVSQIRAKRYLMLEQYKVRKNTIPEPPPRPVTKPEPRPRPTSPTPPQPDGVNRPPA